jgi:hypothetical protein
MGEEVLLDFLEAAGEGLRQRLDNGVLCAPQDSVLLLDNGAGCQLLLNRICRQRSADYGS